MANPRMPLPATPSPGLEKSKALIVSIHDVSPLTRATVAAMREELLGLGVGCVSLLVIPNHHRRGHFLDDPEFCAWLSAQEADEAVIHGYYHARARGGGEGLLSKLITRVYTRDEGEFYDMGRTEALETVTRAQADFARLGMHPDGFIAPAWLLSGPAEDALREAGCAYTTRLGAVVDFRRGKTFHSQSMVYSVRNAWRRATSLAWNSLLYSRLRRAPLLRIGLHPPDFSHPAVWRQIRRKISCALEDRIPMTYHGWINRL